VDLTGLYADTFERLKTQPANKTNLSFQVLAWLHKVQRLLSMRELLHVLAVDKAGGRFSWDQAPLAETVVGSCLGLVTQDIVTGNVRLIHHTLLRFLERNLRNEADEDLLDDSRILKCCLGLAKSFLRDKVHIDENGIRQWNVQTWNNLQDAPFVRYALEHWSSHVSKELEGVESLLAWLSDSDTVHIWLTSPFGWRWAVGRSLSEELSNRLPNHRSWYESIYLSLCLGWSRTATIMFERQAIEPDNLVDALRATIIAFCEKSIVVAHIELCDNLGVLETAADSVLQLAIDCGQSSQVIQRLLKHANVNIRYQTGNTPLITATLRCLRLPIAMEHRLLPVLRLIEGGADVNAQSTLTGDTALHCAIEAAEDVGLEVTQPFIKTLLENDATLFIRNAEGLTPLQIAFESGISGGLFSLLETHFRELQERG